jgi:hypothetical protein
MLVIQKYDFDLDSNFAGKVRATGCLWPLTGVFHLKNTLDLHAVVACDGELILLCEAGSYVVFCYVSVVRKFTQGFLKAERLIKCKQF